SIWFAFISMLLISLLRKETRLNPRKLVETTTEACRTMLVAGVACAAAGILIGSVSLTGVGVLLSGTLVDLSGGHLWLLLLLTAIACFILGLGLVSVPSYIMVAVLAAPAVVQLGVPVIVAHLFVFWMAVVSFITPPVCIAAFLTASIADTNPMQTGWKATKLGVVHLFLPFVFAYNPALCLMGSAGEVIRAVITATFGVVFLGAGVSGYGLRALDRWERILLVIASISLISGGLIADIIGGALGLIVIIWQARGRKRAPNTTVSR
ncbi:MAG: TRAP transporter large permease subunit, partial [Planctomycetota bacterium]